MTSFWLILSVFLLPSLGADLPALPANLELDVIFPRNDTYGQVDNLPVIFAIQNAVLAWDFGFFLWWELFNLTTGADPDRNIAFELFIQSSIPKVPALGDPFFLVNYTKNLGPDSTTGSYYSIYRSGTYRLEWGFRLVENCTRDGQYTNHTIGGPAHAQGDLLFSIAKGGKPVDLLEGGPCPVAGSIIGLQANLSGCAHIGDTGIKPDPCKVSIGPSLANSFSAQLPAISISRTSTTSTSTPTITATRTTTSSRTSATNHAPSGGNAQATAAIFAGVAGFYAMLT